MDNEIKVNDYVRLKDGTIAKVYQYYKGKTYTIGDYESLWGTYDYGVYQMLERR